MAAPPGLAEEYRPEVVATTALAEKSNVPEMAAPPGLIEEYKLTILSNPPLDQTASPSPTGTHRLMLSDCPVPSCLASFPDDYGGLRAHLAQDHFAAQLNYVILRDFRYRYRRHSDQQNWEEHCYICDAPTSGLSHYYLRHDFLDRVMRKFFLGRLKPRIRSRRCLKSGCPHSSQTMLNYLRKAVPSILHPSMNLRS